MMKKGVIFYWMPDIVAKPVFEFWKRLLSFLQWGELILKF
jgi:hypothetical protein